MNMLRKESLETSATDPHTGWMQTASERVAGLEGRHDGLKRSQNILMAAVAMVGGLLVAGMAIVIALVTFLYHHVDVETAKLGARIDAVDARIEAVDAKLNALPQRLADEFRAMRQDMNAQTSAIANAVTAARMMAAPPVTPPSRR